MNRRAFPFDRLNERTDRANDVAPGRDVDGFSEYQMTSAAERANLRLLLEATKAKVLQWKRLDGDCYEARNNEHRFAIEFRYPLYSDEEGSDRGVAYVDLPYTSAHRFFSGTEGMDLVFEILAAGVPSWAEHIEALEESRRKTATLLQELIRTRR
jgi:hypothetical protein